MSTAYLGEGGKHVLAAWEKAGEVYFDTINPSTFKLSSSFAAPGQSNNRKHPAVAANSRGQVLLAWTEGTGWKQGGSLAWQLFSKSGQPLGADGPCTRRSRLGPPQRLHCARRQLHDCVLTSGPEMPVLFEDQDRTGPGRTSRLQVISYGHPSTPSCQCTSNRTIVIVFLLQPAGLQEGFNLRGAMPHQDCPLSTNRKGEPACD